MAIKIDKGLEKFSDLAAKRQSKKPPAFEWQDLALRVIEELKIPPAKRSSVFQACKKYQNNFILRCLNDTKELCQTGVKWKYFFKLISQGDKKSGNRKF